MNVGSIFFEDKDSELASLRDVSKSASQRIGLSSHADTKGRSSGSGCGGPAEQLVEKSQFISRTFGKHPSGAEARVDFAAFAARLKPCPFKTETAQMSFSASCKVVPCYKEWPVSL